MRSLRNPRFALAGALMVGALISSALPARASDGDSDASFSVGATTQLTPVPLLGGTGIYAFSSLVDICASTDTPPDTSPMCGRSEAGAYSFIVCGTGSLAGTANLDETDGGDTVTYTATLVAGLGVESGGTTGVVLLIPTNSNPNNCLIAFDDVTVAISG